MQTSQPTDELIQRVECLWREGMRPDIRQFIGQHRSLAPAQIVQVLRVDQRLGWQAGEPISSSSYLEYFPELHADPEIALDLIWSEYLLRESLGDPPDFEEYARSYPRYESLLRRQLEVHQWIDQAEPAGIPTLAYVDVAKGGQMPHDPTELPHTDNTVLRVPGFEVLAECGRGGMGVVYRAKQLSLGCEVALKVLRPEFAGDSLRLHRFRNEATVAASLKNSHILPIHDVVAEAGGRPVIVMPLVEGCDLAKILDDRRAVELGASTEGRHPSSEFELQEYLRFLLPLLDQVVQAAAVLHEANILHRDIKPSNILVDRIGNVQLTDFGLARLGPGPKVTTVGLGLGTPGYTSPEQWNGEADLDARADVFSLGATLYHALMAELPYGARLVTPDEPPPRRPRIRWPRPSVYLDFVILKALEASRDRRYRTAADMQIEWDLARRGLPPPSRSTALARHLALSIRRRPIMAFNTLAASLMLGISGFAAYRATTPRAPDAIPVSSAPLALTASPDPMALRAVRLKTSPTGARVAMVPLDPDSGLLHPEKLILQDVSPNTTLRLRPGDYFIEVLWPDGRFHQVYRHVPHLGEMSFGSFRHQRWHETANGTIEPPTVEVPQADVVIGMALFEGTESSLLAGHRPGEGRPTWVGAFLLDPTEITIEQYREVEKTIPPQLVNRSVGAHEPVTFVSFDTALDDAEKRGKRLPTELEYLVAATDNGKRRYPWGDSPKQLLNRPWRFGRVDEPTIDQTKTSPPVRNLYSNVAEWLIDWYSADPNVPVALLGPDYRDGRVVRGGPPSVVECNLDGNEAATGPEQRQGYARYKCCPGLGYRCARSVRPIFLK